jgi:hydrogenase expression/formation protein HypE
LNEIAQITGKEILVDESAIPLDESVVSASEILGIDPLQAANEGKIVAVVARDQAHRALELLEDCTLARGASIIGEVTPAKVPRVVMTTRIGGSRVVAEPSGELLPRIC